MKSCILTGGSGTRLWPLSRKNFPKQFLNIDGKESLLQKTISRHLSFLDSNSIFLVTNSSYRHLIEKQIQKYNLSRRNLILEPVSRNTMPAIALAIKYFVDKLGVSAEETIIVSPSDHYIEPLELFLEAVEDARGISGRGYIVTFGVVASGPEVGYGYILRGKEKICSGYKVEKFVEKPSRETAEYFISTGEYFWNAGIFIFSIQTMLEELEQYAPGIFKLFQSYSYETMVQHFENMPSVSVDYAILEKSQRNVVVPLNLEWSDVGSYDQLYDNFPKDDSNNVFVGNVIDHKSSNSMVINNGNRLITTMGLEDVFIVDTEDALLVMKKGCSQEIKNIVNKLKDQL